MKAQLLWANILIIVGLIGMLVGALDPLEGSLIILPGCGLATLGALLGKSRHGKFLTLSFVLVAIGVGALWGLSACGGFGGNSGHSMWWGLLLLPYPTGWIMGVIGIIRRLIEAFGKRTP
ncbi:MAG: hypothetical protein WCJ02_04865 [bacterium]